MRYAVLIVVFVVSSGFGIIRAGDFVLNYCWDVVQKNLTITVVGTWDGMPSIIKLKYAESPKAFIPMLQFFAGRRATATSPARGL